MELVQDNWPYVAGAIVVANLITMATNREWKHPVAKGAYKVLNLVALNFWKNKNAS